MKTRNRTLYHCQGCGRVVRAESDDPVPCCCGQNMTHAATETVAEEVDVYELDFLKAAPEEDSLCNPLPRIPR
ncbi:MAG: hypothetical protein JSS02_05120 [Planctomycetes bacterium]|nr:hypothetical protein [Planctomycetota bacterium]